MTEPDILTATTLDRLPGNGLDPRTGAYSLPPRPQEAWLAVLESRLHAQDLDRDAVRVAQDVTATSREALDGRSEDRLDESGWGVIFGSRVDPAVREALGGLIELRRDQACRREDLFRELTGEAGYQLGESKDDFLIRHGGGPGAVDPRVMPYHLLLIGGPEDIPFTFQYQMDIRHAVGRLDLPTPEDYAAYAESVIRCEKERTAATRGDLVIFGPRNHGDALTALSSSILVGELGERLRGDTTGWRIKELAGEAATKDRLAALLSAERTPQILMTVSHGLCYRAGGRDQRELQGALLCQDWPGPAWKASFPASFYFAADDLGRARLDGLVAVLFACYSGGTPEWSEEGRPAGEAPRRSATSPFVARLAQRLLARGAGAVVAHIDQAWPHSFLSGHRAHLTTFEQLLRRLMSGLPVGWALEPFNRRYAELASDIHVLRELGVGGEKLVDLWTATNDSRGMVVLGDPAVRARAGTRGEP